jgi:hypothetical protein
MKIELKDQLFRRISRRAELKCIFRGSRMRTLIWLRTLDIRRHIYSLFEDMEQCLVHPDLMLGCHCSLPSGGQTTFWWISVINQAGEFLLKNEMPKWPEFVRWRTFMDGTTSCTATGVEVTAGELYIEHQCVDEDAVADFIRTFKCE